MTDETMSNWNDEEGLDQDFKDVEITLENLDEIIRIEREMITSGGVSKQHAISIEEFSPGCMGGDYPIEGFTMAPSRTNYDVAMEAISLNKDTIKVAAIAGVAGLLMRVVWWIFSRMKDTGAAAGGSGGGARASAESAEKAKAAAKTISSVSDTIVPLDAVPEKPTGSNSSRIKDLGALPLSSISVQDVAGLTGKEIGQIMELRRSEFIKKSFANYSEVHEVILKHPSEIVKLMATLSSLVNRRVEKDIALHDEYIDLVKVFSKDIKGTKGSEDDAVSGKRVIVDAAAVGGVNTIGLSSVSTIVKLFGISQDKADDKMLLDAAKEKFTMMTTNVLGSEKVDLEKVNAFINKSSDEMFKYAMDTSEIETLLAKAREKVNEIADLRSRMVSNVDQDQQLSIHYKNMKTSLQVTQLLSTFYFMLSKKIDNIYTSAISSNGKYIDLVKNVLKIGVKFSKAGELENMEKHAEEMDVRVKGLKAAVGKIKQDRAKDLEEIAEAEKGVNETKGFLQSLKDKFK